MNNLRNIVESVGTGSVAGSQMATDSIQSLTDNSARMVDHLANSASDIVGDLSESATGTAESLATGASSLLETGVDTAYDIIGDVSKSLSNVIDTGLGSVSSVADKSVNTATNVLGRGIVTTAGAVGTISKSASNITKSLTQTAGDTLESVIDSSADLVKNTNSTVKFIIKDSIDTATNIKNKLSDLIDDVINPEKLLSNPIIFCILIVFLSMYGPRLSPKLPDAVRDLFNNNIFRFIVIVLVAYLSNKNLQSAILIAVGFSLLLSIANTQQVEEDFEEHYRNNYSNYDTIREVDSVNTSYDNIDVNSGNLDIFGEVQNNLLLKKVV